MRPHLGGKDEVGPIVALGLLQQRECGDGLNGLAQAHLIRQDAVDAVVHQRHQKLHATQLVCAQRPILQHLRLPHLRQSNATTSR